MKEKTIQQKIKEKRNTFLLSLIQEFKESDEIQNLFNCYEYVKFNCVLHKENFYNTLTHEMKELISNKENIWFIPIESKETFLLFLKNNDISIN
ncbi:hypothetical protein EYY60_06870 [Flavobacterium zhairuonense]|uniref:hypothetical protein n=1 Tax=Flavobacterium zhairuonense TaxID=2493631 RepID=UPI00104E8E3B|nr:hypothetical protein [Flavobacterium zhairuonense]KAF2512824.1 hypothetical protein EYY60_06870 [Flavobacterium zhairuonense]